MPTYISKALFRLLLFFLIFDDLFSDIYGENGKRKLLKIN